MSRCRFVLLVLSLLSLSAVGCGSQPPPKKADPAVGEAASQAATSTSEVRPATAESKMAPPKIPDDSAAAAVQRTLNSLEAGNLAEAYDFLPPSYQADIDDLVHEFAKQMDTEVWSRLRTTLKKTIQVLRTKKSEIFDLDLFRGYPEAEPYRKNWESTLDEIAAVAGSDVADLEKLKVTKVQSLLTFKSTGTLQNLDAVGRAIGADLSRHLAGTKVTAIQSAGEQQIVGLSSPRDEKLLEIAYIKFEGHWVPQSLVEHWKDGVAADRAWLQKLPERIRPVKSQVLEMLTQADEILDQLQGATNREQFETAAGKAILTLAAGWPQLHRLATQTVSGSAQSSNLTVFIDRELSDGEQSKLIKLVLKPLQEQEPASDYTLLANDGRTICRLIRFQDVSALRSRLAAHFGLAAEDLVLDTDQSSIQIRLSPQ